MSTSYSFSKWLRDELNMSYRGFQLKPSSKRRKIRQEFEDFKQRRGDSNGKNED